jgi:YaiO family outer membrane protein
LNRILAPVALVLSVLAAPVSAQDASAYDAGVKARLASRPAEARALLETWLQRHPDDVDAKLQLALAELALGDLDAAEAGFREVLAQAPNYADARDGLEAVAARRSSQTASTRGSLLVEGAISQLGGSAADWREVAAELEIPAGSRGTIGGRAAYYRRFERDDLEFVARAGFHPSEDLWLRAFAGGTPKADFRPKIEFGGGFDMRLSHTAATVLSVDAAYQRFPTQDVFTINPGVVKYLAGGNAWVTVRGIATMADGGPVEVGGLLRADFVPESNWRLFGGISNGPDTDLGVVSRVTGLFGGLEAPLGQRISVVGSLSREWRDVSADRTEARLGLKARF